MTSVVTAPEPPLGSKDNPHILVHRNSILPENRNSGDWYLYKGKLRQWNGKSLINRDKIKERRNRGKKPRKRPKNNECIWKIWVDSHTTEEFKQLFKENKTVKELMVAIGYSAGTTKVGKGFIKFVKSSHIDYDKWKSQTFIEREKIIAREKKKLSKEFWETFVTFPEELRRDDKGRIIRVNVKNLIKYILENKLLEHKCEECGIGPFYNNKKLVLQLDHKDGNPSNNTLIYDIEKQKKINPKIGKTNLRFLCPNCHSQTPTWGAKNGKHNC